MNIRTLLIDKAIAAMVAAGLPEDTNPAVTQSTRPQFGDYQINGAMGAAKKMKSNPRELAQKIIDNLDVTDIAEKTEIAGPGFINIHLKPEFLANSVKAANSDAKLAVNEHANPQTVVVDYSSPNLAKEMHVGHMRNLCLGDAMIKIMRYCAIPTLSTTYPGDVGTHVAKCLWYFKYKNKIINIKEGRPRIYKNWTTSHNFIWW